MIVDTGPLVAIFDRRDPDHAQCVSFLRAMKSPLVSTMPVLTELFHLLGPASRGAQAARTFITRGGLQLFPMDFQALGTAFDLMETYADRPMDLADASLVVAAEQLAVVDIFTLDRSDFSIYRVRIGRGRRTFRIHPER